MPKKMSKPDKAMLIAVIVIAVLAAGVYLKGFLFKPLAILPELDNRINYFDEAEDMSGFVRTNYGIANDKFECYTDDLSRVRVYRNTGYSTTSDIFTISYRAQCTPIKDFTRLAVFIRWQSPSNTDTIDFYGSGIFGLGGTNAWHNTEIRPNYLQVGVYDIFNDGEIGRAHV